MPSRKAKPRVSKARVTRAAARPKVPDASPLVVGLGASAGGLAALEQFVAHVRTELGAAYVVVQHLDPEHASVLTELLQRVSPLPVVEVTDGMSVRPGVVHVIPPNREMEIFAGTLLLTVPAAPRGKRLAVDGFFRSLADEQGAHAVGVVLSGTGSDGALGLRAIQEAGGLCLVQEPSSAKFDGMPAAALLACPSSLVGPADRLPSLLAGAVKGLGDRPRRAPPAPDAGTSLTRILTFLRTATGRDFAQYKRSSVTRRVHRRMSANGIEDLEAYVRHLREHPAEVKSLVRELLINVTGFFRDPEAFASLRSDVLPKLVAGRTEGEPIRVWVAGCATGEEAYSITILLRELLEEAHSPARVQVYGTDLDDEAIATARAGVYPAAIEGSVTPERLARFFVKEEGGYRVRKEIREQVVFAVQDLVKDPPFTRVDLISCRNVFIYLEPELQERILALFHYALRAGGVLFLSPAEGVGNHGELFAPIDRKWRLFRALHTVASVRAVLARGLSRDRAASEGEAGLKPAADDFAEITRRLLLQHHAPPSVLADRAGTVLYVYGDTGPYLRQAPGRPTLSLSEMAREGLQVDLRTALKVAAARGKAVHRPGITVGEGRRSQTVDLTVRPVTVGRGAPGLLLVSFQESLALPAGKPARGKAVRHDLQAQRIQELTRALASAKENLQATIEERQTANEELQSSNEELQSTNEEVQASNEELETAKEELQSVNEELTTVNAELQAKVEQLTATQDDLKNLFDAINVGTVFLDERLRVRRFTREACRIYRLAPTDVGRPLSDIKSNLVDRDLLADAQGVLDSLVPVEADVRSADGGWFQARLFPYRTLDNAIRGVVLTFTDVSKRVAAEAVAQGERELKQRLVETVREPLLVLDAHLRVVSASPAFTAEFAPSALPVVGRHLYELADARWNLPALRDALERVLPEGEAFDRMELVSPAGDGTPRGLYVSARRVAGGAGVGDAILLTFSR